MKGAHIEASLKEIIVARIDIDADLFCELKKLVKEKNIRSAAILSITGSLWKAGLRIFRGGKKTDVCELQGPFEMSGSGTITESEKEGEPYVHVHLTVTGAEGTYLGHLIEGCKVRTFGEIIILPIEGITMKKIMDKDLGQPVLHLSKLSA